MKPEKELIALALWVLLSLSLFTPGLMRLVMELFPTTPVDTQLITYSVISLCIFLLPTLFFSAGLSAWRRLSYWLATHTLSSSPPVYRDCYVCAGYRLSATGCC